MFICCNDREDRKRGGWGKLRVVSGEGRKDNGMRTMTTKTKNEEGLLEGCELSVRGNDDAGKTMTTTTTKEEKEERWLKGNDLGDRV